MLDLQLKIGEQFDIVPAVPLPQFRKPFHEKWSQGIIAPAGIADGED